MIWAFSGREAESLASSGISSMQGGQKVPQILIMVTSLSFRMDSVTSFPSRSSVVNAGTGMALFVSPDVFPAPV